MNTRAPEPRNFWGLTKQIGPWKTTSVDQTHLAQGYDSPHNNRQFVTPYQQDGTATIPDQAYTSLSIVEPSSGKEFKGGRIKRVKQSSGFALDQVDNTYNIRERLPTDTPIDVDNPDDTPISRTTTNLMTRQAKIVKERDTRAGAMDVDEVDSSNVKPRLESDFLTTDNAVVQSIHQVLKTDRPDFRTLVATNAWIQPATQVATSHMVSQQPIVQFQNPGGGTRGQVNEDVKTSQATINAMLRANRAFGFS